MLVAEAGSTGIDSPGQVDMRSSSGISCMTGGWNVPMRVGYTANLHWVVMNPLLGSEVWCVVNQSQQRSIASVGVSKDEIKYCTVVTLQADELLLLR